VTVDQLWVYQDAPLIGSGHVDATVIGSCRGRKPQSQHVQRYYSARVVTVAADTAPHLARPRERRQPTRQSIAPRAQ
jgi:hypothetical protein